MDLFKRMQKGEFPDGAHILRAKIDMASPNINLRDPAIYRIRHATHHNTGDKWCVYPMYTSRTRSGCAGEHHALHLRWVRGTSARSATGCSRRLAEGGKLQRPLPQQISSRA